ncbi:MAG TPA: LysR family transcriptional regulator [Rhodospirillaceae bacterium]|nr:LysR family transcriptional regulator [Rhodospirillaceae bacterium]MAX63863.1 LysR family transcriptional regulator [Rhodospirillaceae bacterium]HAE02961.1 LysR family transcriptional regulator [Rhodospirillaceae bacterium]HAJ19970.1 LysR family transcriptional regulator [Rhodospirillaceae bacterium]HBM13329.1 LysR family transcriptional regulator [Rhodospirillaceae bacterium]|tara:strand:+ start:7426 stop:8325 length:900 start_codon:yes stop_codon:yes gene_type:complete
MDRDVLIHLPVILSVARCRGFAAAAKDLGMSASAVSHAVKTVEDRLGLPLFARTTRTVSLTDWGMDFINTVAPAYLEISEAMERVQVAQGQVSGLLRINMPYLSLHKTITPVIKELHRRHPKLTVELFADNAMTDIIADRFDAGIRLGGMIAQDMVTVRLAPPFRWVVVGSPDYLATRGTPKSIEDLKHHTCISYRMTSSGRVYQWELMQDDVEIRVETSISMVVNTGQFAIELALDGIGLAYMAEPSISEPLRDGRLVQVLPETSSMESGLFLYFTRSAGRTPKLRAFIDTAREVLKL